ncbi:MAG TPA: Wzz/FepE/Etk N-terminal domain-containing protein [Candidatus Udaeobacter sp.]|nr:Wzz/FepE/Etk N-terminal domain-containing protein [Candidatus Udaeobacter sp.]
MAEIRRETQHPSGMKLGDILFALFKRKKTIIVCAMVGIIAAAAVYFLYPPSYESQAKLLVRYVTDKSVVDPIDAEKASAASNNDADRVMGAEMEILTSWDLAMQVAQAIGPQRLLPPPQDLLSRVARAIGLKGLLPPSGASATESDAAGAVSSGLKALSSKGSNIILVSYKNRDPQVATLVLQELLSRYFVKHLEVHRSAGAFDFVTQQTDQVRARLNQTEDALKSLRAKTGIASLKEGSVALTAEAAKTQEQLNAAEADLAEQQALVNQIVDKKEKKGWRTKPASSEKSPQSAKARVAGTQAKVETLKSRLRDVQQRTKQLSELGPQMEDLERKREMDETNYKYFAASLEKARIDEALDPSKMPNISAVQRPSPSGFETKKRNKILMALVGGGIALGMALALLKGLILNQTVGRPLQLETQLHIPLMLSIPYANGRFALPRNGSPANSGALTTERRNPKLAPWEAGHFIRPYCDAIRDRLGLYFELNHLTHKPKLVGVTGFADQAGASTLAAGLAASLSETNDGKVLLVDVNLGPQEVHPFFKGKPAYPLNKALKPSDSIASAADNLYLATVGSPNSGGPAQLGLKKFFDMMPNMKASDFDYIIFDMPPLDQTSPTWGMAAFMDKLLLVVEAEKNSRDVIKRSYGKLIAERNNVAVVVNKSRSYVPKWLDFES